MALSQYYVDPGGGNDTTGDGSIGTPWATVQHALDNITRDSTNGDCINIKAGTADTLSAPLDFSTYGDNPGGTPGEPIMFRGYTSTANDGGIGVIDGNGGYIINLTTLEYFAAQDMRFTNGGSDGLLRTERNTVYVNCTFDNTSGVAVSQSAAAAILILRTCYFYDCTGSYALENASMLTASYIVYGGTGTAVEIPALTGECSNNIIVLSNASANGIEIANSASNCVANTIYQSAAGTGIGIVHTALSTSSIMGTKIINNIISGFSGVGGIGIDYGDLKTGIYGSNAFYNCTSNTDTSGIEDSVLVAADDTLASDPFVNAASGNFALNGTVAGATEDAWPESLANGNTTDYADKGAVQAGAGSGGGGGGRRPRIRWHGV